MTSKRDKYYIRRCHELSIISGKQTNPNPNVGAVIVENDEIIGEGWHEKYGKSHAEINALNSVAQESKKRISQSTMYVSLEPCSIQGKTPPCTDAILKEGIKNVIISARDKTFGVDQVSEYTLKQNNVELTYGVDQFVGDYIAKPRNVFVTEQRPYVILKWAQSKDGFIGKVGKRTSISNEFTSRYVHQLRANVDAILVGRRTVEVDNPSLTNRYYSGSHPTRVIIGKVDSKEDISYKVFSEEAETIQLDQSNIATEKSGQSFLQACCEELHQRNMMNMLVEGGSQTLNAFIKEGLWDECHIITSDLILNEGIKAPKLLNIDPIQEFNILNDRIRIFHNPS